MNLELRIAKRYLFSKKSQNVINIISGISVVGVAVGVLALVVVMSAFNGLEELIGSLYSAFDPDLKITSTTGKTFKISELPAEEIRSINGVKNYSVALEETVYLQYKNYETVATIKGVDDEFAEMTGLDTMIVEGEFLLEKGGYNYAILGYGIAYDLNIFIDHVHESMKVFTAKKTGKLNSLNPQNAFIKKGILPSGVFAINQDFDMKYVLVPIDFARDLLQRNDEATSLEIGLEDGVSPQQTKAAIQSVLGGDYSVKTRYELNELIFKTNQTEKWITFLILTFILVIATFNVVGALTMLIIEKKRDISLLISMGAEQHTIRNVFMIEGVLITGIGGIVGISLGGTLCYLQQTFGLIPLQGLIVDYYPVSMKLMDFLAVFITVILIGIGASWFPVRYVTRNHFT